MTGANSSRRWPQFLTSTLRLLPRLFVAAGLTTYVLWKSDPRAVLAAAAGADWRPIGVAALLVFVDRSLMAYRWVVLLCTIDRASRPPLGAVMRIFFVSTFVGTFLPASVGGDAVRAYSLAKLNVRGEDSVASVVMDRLLGVASILLMAIVGLPFAGGLVDNRGILIVLGVIGGIVAVAALVIFKAVRGVRHPRDPSVSGVSDTSDTLARRMLVSIRKYASYPGQLANVLLCSIAVQALRIIQAYYLGRSLGIDAPLSAYFAFVPLILLVMLLPVTVNGIGTSQAAFVWFFARAGVPSAPAFALSVLFVALGIIGNLPGAILFAVGHSQPGADRVRSSLGRTTG